MTADVPSASALIEEGLARWRDGRTDSARALFRQALAREPGHPEASFQLGRAVAAGDDLSGALELIAVAVHRAPKTARYRAGLGEVLRRGRRLRESELALEEAVSLDDAQAPIWRSLAEVRKQRGRLEAAVAAFRSALALSPEDVRCLDGIGTAYAELGELELSRESFERALSLAPRHPRVIYNYTAHHRVDTALHRRLQLKEILSENSSNREAHVRLHFALAKTLDDGRVWQEAFTWADRGKHAQANALPRR